MSTTFDDITLRGMAADIGAATEKALLAYSVGDVDLAQEWDTLAHYMKMTARDAAKQYDRGLVSVEWANHMRKYISLKVADSCQPAHALKPTNLVARSMRPVESSKRRLRVNGPSYTEATALKPSRCRGCGMIAGMGHYQGCFDNSVQVLKLPALKSVKHGTAAFAKSNGKLIRDISAFEEKNFRGLSNRNDQPIYSSDVRR